MTSALDVHRQEAQRDFGDPVGMASRALIEGLFGIRPNLLAGDLHITPGFPAEWLHASIEHPDLSLQWSIENKVERYSIHSHFKKPLKLILSTRAHSTSLPYVTVNGASVKVTFDEESIGCPQLQLECDGAFEWSIELHWSEEATFVLPEFQSYKLGDQLQLSRDAVSVDDPQNALSHGAVKALGNHVVFAHMQRGVCRWWLPIGFHVEAPSASVTSPVANSNPEPIDLSFILNQNIADIFKRSYAQPRSPHCSLSIPEQGYGGWAAFNMEPRVDDTGLRSVGGHLQTQAGILFAAPSGPLSPNCRFLSWWHQDERSIEVPLKGSASALHLLMTGTTNPQASRMEHGHITVSYVDGGSSQLILRNPETWWPIEQDYLLDDYLFVNRAPLPTRVDLKTGRVRQLDRAVFKGKGGMIDGGAATVLSLPLDPSRPLRLLRIEATLYGVVLALLAATLERTASVSVRE
jgi:hypothetical protein